MAGILKFMIRVQANAASVARAVSGTLSGLNQVESKAGAVGRALKEAFSLDKLKGDLMSIPGMQFLMNPYTAISAGVGAITSLGSQAESTATAFNVLVGSEEKAAKLLEDINTFAAKTPYSQLDLAENAKMMLSFGVQAEEVNTHLQRLGDIAMGDKNKLSGLALVYGQVASAGKMQGQDLLQFINQGFNPLKELEKMTGKTYAELKEMSEKGQIGVAAINAAIQHATSAGGAFYQMSDKMSQTTMGKWSTLVGTIQQEAANLYQYIKPTVIGIMDLFQSIVPPIVSALSVVFECIAKVINFMVEWKTEIAIVGGVLTAAYVAPTVAATGLAAATGAVSAAIAAYKAVCLAAWYVTQGWAGVQMLLNAVLTANPIGVVVAAVGALIAAVVYCWNKFAGFRAFMKTMWDTMKGFANLIKDVVIGRIKELLNAIGSVGKAIKALFKGDFKGAANAVGDAAKGFAGVETAKRIKAGASQLVGDTKQSWKQNLTAEQKKQREKESKKGVSSPALAGSDPDKIKVEFNDAAGKGGKNGGGKSSSSLATGGTRNTSITMHIGKFFDNINITMLDRTDTTEMERVILQTINRSLAIATSADR